MHWHNCTQDGEELHQASLGCEPMKHNHKLHVRAKIRWPMLAWRHTKIQIEKDAYWTQNSLSANGRLPQQPFSQFFHIPMNGYAASSTDQSPHPRPTPTPQWSLWRSCPNHFTSEKRWKCVKMCFFFFFSENEGTWALSQKFPSFTFSFSTLPCLISSLSKLSGVFSGLGGEPSSWRQHAHQNRRLWI